MTKYSARSITGRSVRRVAYSPTPEDLVQVNFQQIRDEYERNGRLSGQAMKALSILLRDGNDPYGAISLAGDACAFQLADAIAAHLTSEDSMVRWNAAGVLFTRFRDVHFSRLCLDLLERESDTLVRGIALAGAGELLPLLDDGELQKLLAMKLRQVMDANDEFPEMRGAAYLGIEAAVGTPPLERAPADRMLDLEKDVKPEVLRAFGEMYGV